MPVVNMYLIIFPVGDYYVKFEYDSSKYQVTDYKKEGVNSDKTLMQLFLIIKAVTDKISITDFKCF